jgi:tellurite resistance protein
MPAMNDVAALTPQDALIALMISVSASDEDIRTAELVRINNVVNHLPIFADYAVEHLPQVSHIVFDMLEKEDGLDQLFNMIRDVLPERLFETAYAFACDVAAADGRIYGPEARMLEEIRHELNIDRLHAAAIERGARARHMVL